jgi:hypothetical protein
LILIFGIFPSFFNLDFHLKFWRGEKKPGSSSHPPFIPLVAIIQQIRVFWHGLVLWTDETLSLNNPWKYQV